MRAAVAAAALGVIVMIAAERELVGVASLLPLFVTKEGELLLGLAVAVVACGLAVVAEDFWPDRWSLAAVGVTAAAAVLLHVIAGHADAPATLRLVNILEQWIHMTAIGVWIGGLAWLLLGIRGQGRAERAAAVRAFSRIATITLVVVLVTGLARAVEEVGSLGALFDTSYGDHADRQGRARRGAGGPGRPQPLLLGAGASCAATAANRPHAASA